MSNSILLGFEVGSGEPVYLPLHHLAIFGITQLSGKTTTIEAVTSRSGLRAVAFIVKRGEAGFTKYNLVTPYYKPRSDWQYVEGLLNVALKEKVQYQPFMRWAILQVTKKHPESLRQVLERSEECEKEFSRRKEVFEQLSAYLRIIVPELEQHVFSTELKLNDGINVMDLSDMQLEVQQIVIASTIEYVLSKLDHVVVIVPEAWESLPQGKMTPIKWVAQQFIRKGASLGNYLWLDSFPSYEVLLVKINDQVSVVSFEELWNNLKVDGKIETDGYEEKLTPIKSVDVLHAGQSRLRWVRLSKMFRHPFEGKILRINTVKGLVDLSANHPIMKYPCYLVEASRIEVGDRLCMRDFYGRVFSDKGLFVGTERLAETYGFFAAEGWPSENDHLCFSNKDRVLLDEAAESLEFDLHHTASLLSPRNGVYTLDTNSPVLCDHFRNKCYATFMTDYSARTKIVPQEIMNGPKKIKEAFLNAYFKGDGHPRRGSIGGFCTVSRRLALGVLWLIHSTSNKQYSVHIRDDKPDVIEISLNKTDQRRDYADRVKKIVQIDYVGLLYDIEAQVDDHTFNVGIGNFRVKNSQDIGGIDKTPLRQCDNWLMGRMKEAHEVERILKQLLGMKVPAEEIQTLALGHFYAAIGNDVKKVYVLPAGVPESVGVDVAKGIRTPESVRDEYLSVKVMESEDLVYKEKYEEEKRKREECEKEFARQLEHLTQKAKEVASAEALKKVEEIKKLWRVDEYQETIATLKDEKARLEIALKRLEPLKAFGEALGKFMNDIGVATPKEASSENINLEHKELAVNIQHKGEQRVNMSTDTIEGQVLYCAVNDLPKEGFTFADMQKALQENGWGVKETSIRTKLSLFVNDAKLIKTEKGYRLPQHVKFNVEKSN